MSSVTVVLQSSSGNAVQTSGVQVHLDLVSATGKGSLSGSLTASTVDGIATFDTLAVDTVAQNYQLVASTYGAASANSSYFSITPASNGSVLTVPDQNQCDSLYDHFYENEPGVFAYWPLCEKQGGKIGYDYLGQWPMLGGIMASPQIVGGSAGPVPDGESAAESPDAPYKIENLGISLNKNAGTIAVWFNGDAGKYHMILAQFAAHTNHSFATSSNISIEAFHSGSSLCFSAVIKNSAASAFKAEQCGYAPDTWHRVLTTWNNGSLVLFVDGVSSATESYPGALDDAAFTYQVFPGESSTGKRLSLAKALVSNEAWDSAQVFRDYQPDPVPPPASGVYVTTSQLGTVHRDVLGFADNNQNVATTALTSALNAGLATGAFKALRYAGGFGGIQADAGDWRHGSLECTQTASESITAQNVKTSNNVDTYLPNVALPSKLSIGYTVNYGSNPPECNAGGDPVTNGASLVRYLNIEKTYGVKYWEIGNEQYGYGGGLIDLHSNPYLNGGSAPSTYPTNEPAFYDEMKAVDSSIQIGVPAIVTFGYNAMLNYEIPTLLNGKYDAVVMHRYPIKDPVADGTTLYQERIASGTQIHGTLLALQTQLLDAGKPKDAIWVTEWSGTNNAGKWSKQNMGAVEPLFVATELAEFMQAGVQYATWWEQGMTDVCSPFNFDGTASAAYNWWSGCGNAGLIYTGPVTGTGEKNIGMKAGDLTPAGRGFQVLAQSGIVTEGEHMLQTYTDTSGAPWLKAYAATHGSSYAVILINRDRDATHVVPVSIAGQSHGSAVTQWTYGRAQYDESYFGNWSVGPVSSTAGAWTGPYEATLPPWSVNVLVFQQ